jgi:DNA mismatch endonuclease (patch repair protein)
MDRISSDTRSRTMAAIRGQGTSIENSFEILVRRTRFLFVMHPRWLGSPDLAFPQRGVVVFLDSCFWHKCPSHFRQPKSRTVYWEAKIGRNVARDREIRAEYQALGWSVLQFWEHAIREYPLECLKELIAELRARKRSTLTPPPPRRTPGGGVKFR